MNFLEMCQELVLEAGYSGEILTVDDQRGQFARVVRWIRNAATVLQTEHPDWTFMTREFSFDTTAGKQKYSPADLAALGVENVDRWLREGFRVSKGDGPSGPLRHVHMQLFARRYANPRESRPVNWTESIDRGLVFGNIPDDVYTITGKYQMSPVTLLADEDVPPVPEAFHQAIVWKGLAYYGTNEEAPGAVERGESEYAKAMGKMRLLYLPDVRMFGRRT